MPPYVTRLSSLVLHLGFPVIASTRFPVVSHGLMQKTWPKRREGAATQAGGDNLLRPLTTLELGQPSHLASSRTRVGIPLRTFLLKEVLARASSHKHVSLGPQDLDRSLGRHVRPYTETRQPIRPKDPAVARGGKCYKGYPGLGNRWTFTPGSSGGPSHYSVEPHMY